MSCDEWLPLVLQAAENRLDDLDAAERRRFESLYVVKPIRTNELVS